MYDGTDFSTYIESERQRLKDRRQTMEAHIAEHQAQLAELDREFAAIDAYERAKTGKSTNTATAKRARYGSKREAVYNVIGERGGASRGDILRALGVNGDKSGEMAVSNALTAIKKAGKIMRDGGVWYLAAQGAQEVPE